MGKFAADEEILQKGPRLLAGCIPYRITESKLEVLMVTSKRNCQNLVFPKGGFEVTDASLQEAATREALEEAGVQGHVKDLLGTWSGKRACEVHMYSLEVTEVLDTWHEQNRKRQWFVVTSATTNAKERCRHGWMVDALKKFIEHSSTTSEASELSHSARL